VATTLWLLVRLQLTQGFQSRFQRVQLGW